MISLFLAQFIMLTIAYVTKPEIVCTLTAAIMHFFWLSMFLWTNVLAFDLARVFGTQSPRSSTFNKRLLLGLYMLYGWGLPAVVVALCLTLHFSGKSDFRYGRETFCWFSNHRSLLYAFAIPVAICIVFNFILYIITVFGIWKVRRASEFAVNENERGKKRKDELKLYIKLSILMGLTWSLVFITVYRSEIIIWYIFIILNGLQGFFIFIAFTCNRQTLAKWKGAYATRFEAHSSSRLLTKTTSA
ncbi:adhesion G protein-coupled receptor E4-like [Anneissia japonica]|uniref:adhesion G protein-coupled receptor E4-like n=1 Tax=Anneissia japonica TaxID=1529436 RepID=UPI0014257BFB|nr:adhesion G protein-coupled receptor E4-like [Anneissia japonica]